MNSRASFCYLTTTGRRSGRPHQVEMWFALEDGRLYMLSGAGGGSDWVRNIRANPSVRIRVDGTERDGNGRVIEPDTAEDALARRLLASKYEGWREGRPLSEWARTALPVTVELA